MKRESDWETWDIQSWIMSRLIISCVARPFLRWNVSYGLRCECRVEFDWIHFEKSIKPPRSTAGASRQPRQEHTAEKRALDIVRARQISCLAISSQSWSKWIFKYLENIIFLFDSKAHNIFIDFLTTLFVGAASSVGVENTFITFTAFRNRVRKLRLSWIYEIPEAINVRSTVDIAMGVLFIECHMTPDSGKDIE